jgi:formate/nitrite transporter FocA (FNT family)
MIVFKIFCGKSKKKTVAKVFYIVSGLIFVFIVIWIIVGSAWLFTDSTCNEKFYSLWAMTLAVLIVNYIGLGLICCCGFCAGCMVFIKGRPSKG